MLSIRRSCIPSYLHSSDYFRCLDPDDDEFISFPKKYLKLNLVLNSTADVIHLLHTIRFWGVHGIPNGLMEYFLRNRVSKSLTLYKEALIEFGRDLRLFPVLFELSNAEKRNRMLCAIRSGDVDILQSLNRFSCKVERIPPGIAEPCREALLLGHLDCLKFLHEEMGFPLCHNSCTLAAQLGHLECLKYAYAQRCDLKNSCTVAARHGNLDCLKFAHSKGGAIGPTALMEAAQRGHGDCCNYIVCEMIRGIHITVLYHN